MSLTLADMIQRLYDRSFTVYGDDCGLSLFRYDEKKMNVIFMVFANEMVL
jgi:hypothetical protein